MVKQLGWRARWPVFIPALPLANGPQPLCASDYIKFVKWGKLPLALKVVMRIN